MEQTPLRGKRPPAGHHVLAFVLSYLVTRALWSAIGFRYNLFSDPFDPAKLLVDLGAWIAVYMFILWALARRAARRARTTTPPPGADTTGV